MSSPPPPPPPPPLKLNLFCAICQDGDSDDLLFFMLDTCTHSYHETCLRQMVSEKRKETGVYDSSGAFCPVCKLPMDSDDCDYLSHAYRDLHIRTAYVPSRKDARLRITIEEVFDEEVLDEEDSDSSILLLEVSRKRVVHTIYNPMSVLPRIRKDESAKRRNKRARKERRDRYSRYRRQRQQQQQRQQRHRLELPEEEELDMQAGELSDTELEIIVL